MTANVPKEDQNAQRVRHECLLNQMTIANVHIFEKFPLSGKQTNTTYNMKMAKKKK